MSENRIPLKDCSSFPIYNGYLEVQHTPFSNIPKGSQRKVLYDYGLSQGPCRCPARHIVFCLFMPTDVQFKTLRGLSSGIDIAEAHGKRIQFLPFDLCDRTLPVEKKTWPAGNFLAPQKRERPYSRGIPLTKHHGSNAQINDPASKLDPIISIMIIMTGFTLSDPRKTMVNHYF